MSASKILRIAALTFILLITLVGQGRAQGQLPPRPPQVPSFPPVTPPALPGMDGLPAGAKNPSLPAIALGTPGLSFRYVQTFGETEKGLLEDDNHFYDVAGVTTDGTDLWVTDSWNNRVVKFDNSGNYLQKIGQAGVEDASGTSLDYISDVAVDSDGNVWVVDSGANHVVKYDASGKHLSELGQSWNGGSANNQFNDPIGIAFDSAGNIYVSDSGIWYGGGNQRIQIFDSSGTYLNTIGETGVTGSNNSHFNYPRGIAIYANTLYVADAYNQRVQIFDVSDPSAPGYVATMGNTGDTGTDSDHFNQPEGVVVDASFIYVADSNNNRIQIFDRATYSYMATIGSSGSGTGQFNHPSDVSVDKAGNIYVADNYNDRVQEFNKSRTYLSTRGTTGVPYLTDGFHYYRPEGVSVAADGSIYIVEERGHRLVKLNAAGTPQWTVGYPGQNGTDNQHLFFPNDVAVDGSGRVYVADNCNNRVQIFTAAGAYSATLGTGWGTGNNQLEHPSGVTVDKNGYIYVADSQNQRVQIYSASRAYVATLGIPGVSGSDNAHFNDPRDVAVDTNGTIYVADQGNHRVQVFTASRTFSRSIGETGVTGNDFGHLSSWGPHRLAVDAQNRIYVSDAGNQRVQVFDSTGAYLTTVGGASGTGSNQFSGPMGVAIGPDGALYVADYWNNNRIQKFAPGTPGWVQRNINGFGDRSNGNVQTLEPFAGQLFAGTYNGNGAQIWKTSTGSNWTQSMTPGFGSSHNIGVTDLLAFNNQLYAGVRDDTDGANVFRSNDGSTWNPVVTAGLTDTKNAAVYRFAEFNGQIYAGTGIFAHTHGAEIWRSPSGDADSWTQVVSDGLGDLNNYIMRTSEVFNGYLYFGTANLNTTNYTTSGGVIIRSDSGDSGSWTKVTLDGFGDANNYTISGLAAFNGYLYASTTRWNDSGIQVWRCQTCGSADDWEEVVDNGFGNSYNWGISTLQVFNGKLFMAVGNGLSGIQVWQTTTGNTGEWTLVGNEGFGQRSNDSPYYNNVTVFNSSLYIGTENGVVGGQVWQALAPGAFNKTSPANAATNQPINPTLKWAASSNATSYEYCLATSACTAASAWTSTGTATSQALSGLKANKTYYWQVRAVNSFGTSYANAGTGWSFKTALLSTSFPSMGSYDGWVLESSVGKGIGGTLNSTNTTLMLGDDKLNRQYRSILSFDTSSLPDNAVITSVTLKVMQQSILGTSPFKSLGALTVDMRKPYFGTSVGLVASDFQATAGKSAVGTFSATPVGSWYTAALASTANANVNLSGTTQFRLRFATASNKNGVSDAINLYSGNFGTTADRPVLIIQFYVP